MNSAKSTNKFVRFLRNNAALLLIIFSILAITTVVLVATLSGRTPAPDDNTNVHPIDPDDPVDVPTTKDPVKVYFAAPVKYSNISMEYSDGSNILFVYNSTLGKWRAHRAVDLVAEDGSDVCAMYDGTVIDVSESYALGNTVIIDHGDGVVATYASLGEVSVVKGQALAKGDVIGTVSTSASNEHKDGAHLHLGVTLNGKNADPMPYVNGEIFREVIPD